VKKVLLLTSLMWCLFLAACGAPSQDEAAHSSESVAASWPALEKAAVLAGAKRAMVPSGPPPGEVVIRDLVAGKGRPIRKGDWFVVSYVAFSYETRQVREDKRGTSKWNWTWGVGELSRGWEIGLRGLRGGGVRELIVPSQLAYGTGALVYIIKLQKLSDQPEKT
jgi:peptidylprolyl isomerase